MIDTKKIYISGTRKYNWAIWHLYQVEGCPLWPAQGKVLQAWLQV